MPCPLALDLQDVLRDNSAPVLAAYHARVFGMSGAGASLATWRRALRSAAPGPAGAMGHFAVSVADANESVAAGVDPAMDAATYAALGQAAVGECKQS